MKMRPKLCCDWSVSISNSSKVPFVCFNRLSDELVFSSLFQPERRDDIKFTLKSTLALQRERINYKVQEFVKFYESFCPVNVRNRHPFFVSNRLLSLYFPSASKTGFYFLVKLRKLTRAVIPRKFGFTHKTKNLLYNSTCKGPGDGNLIGMISVFI